MSSSDVGVAADGPGKRIDTVALTSDEAGTPTVQRQGVWIGDPTTFANKAKVDASGNIAVAVSNLPGTQPVSGTVGVSSLPGSPAQEGTDATGVSAPAGAVGIRGWLSGIYNKLSNTLTVTISGTPTVSVSNFPGTQPVSGSVSVSNLPATQPVSGTVTANVGTGTMPTSVVDGQNATLGNTADAASTFTVVGLLKNIKAALAGTLTISGAVTNSNLDVALSTRLKPADTLTAVTTVGAVTAITNALPTGANTIGAVTNANLDVALSTRLKPADTLAGVTTVAAVTAITNALPAGTNTIGAVKQVTQASLTATVCSALTGTGAQTGQSLDGYDGAGTLQITAIGTVAAQAVSLQIEGSVDNANWERIAIAQFGATDNPVYSTANFTLTPGAGTISHLYALRDTVKFIRVNATANNLGTGLTISYYSNPV